MEYASDHKNTTYNSKFNLTFSQGSEKQDYNNENQAAIMGYLKEKILHLEIENNELKKEMLLKSNDKERLDYFLRLRKDMMEEIEKLKAEKLFQEIKLNTEIENLNDQLNNLTKKLNSKEEEQEHDELVKNFNSENQNLFSSEKIKGKYADYKLTHNKQGANTMNASKYFQNLIENDVASKFLEDNFFLNPKGLKNSKGFQDSNYFHNNSQMKDKDLLSRPDALYQSTVPYSDVQSEEYYKDNTNIHIHNSGLTGGSPIDYLSVIQDLEKRIELLEGVLKEKEQEITNLQNNNNTLNNETDSQVSKLTHEVEVYKQKYISILSSKKSISAEFEEFHEKQSENYRRQTDKNIYELEKKIVILEKMNSKYEKEIEKLTKISADVNNVKQLELDNIKENMVLLLSHYEQIYQNYEENLKLLTKQIDSIRQLYHARETEFINITNYYIETINDYSKSLMEVNDPNNFKQLENQYITSTKELEESRKKIEEYIRELTNLRADYTEAKPNIRSKITDAMNSYEESIFNIVENHKNIEKNLNKIIEFKELFDNKFIFFGSLLEDNKKFEEKNNILECQLKMFDIDAYDKQIFSLKEQNFTLAREIEVKNNTIKEYELSLSRQEITLTNLTKYNSKKAKDASVPSEIVNKLKNEILVLSSKTANLIKMKDDIEKFYQCELKLLMDKSQQKSEKIEELMNVIKKLENDSIIKKETVFNLWMLEFKEFKDKLITISDIKSTIDKFKAEGEELTIHKDRVYNEELYLLRNEIKIKDDLYSDMKNNYELEIRNLLNLVDSYKNNINGNIVVFEKLSDIKKSEINNLKNEKSKLEEIEKSKKKLSDNELKLWNEQRDNLRSLLCEHTETKNKEITILKAHIEILQKELENSRKLNENNLESVITSIDTQMNIFKERELFTVSQLLDIEDKFTVFREEKERFISLLKDELQEIKSYNLLLGKIKSEEK